MPHNQTVIIPSATLVPQELQSIGRLPGIIYPINQRLVFDYLREQYTEHSKCVKIVCFEKAEKVARTIAAYKDNRVEIKMLDELKDLGHTIYSGLEGVEGSVIINFADTIVFDNIFEAAGDAFYYSTGEMTDTWTYYKVNNGIITEVLDKIDSSSDEFGKIFVGVFQINNAAYFRSCLEQAFGVSNIKMSTFYYALCEYSKVYPFQEILTQNWFDIGHADTYYNSKLEVKAREFNHITIDRNRGILKKTSDEVDKFIGEILWYLKLPADIEYVRPRIFSYSVNYSSPSVTMEYYDYHTLHELFLYGDLTKHQWKEIFKRIRFVCDDFKRYKVVDSKIKSSLEDMYLTKTLQRLSKLKANSIFAPFFDDSILVNGKRYKSLADISEILERVVPSMLYDVEEFNIIHGDLCFANMMVDSNCSFIKVIDPRGKFGDFDIYGDMRYELAKLFHSIDGKYDYIIKDLFSVKYDLAKCEIEFNIEERKRDFDLFDLFIHVFDDAIGNDIKKIELIEALLFLSMIPLHGESIQHQLAMLATGLTILERVCPDICE